MKILNWIDKIVGKYLDAIYLFLIAGGSLAATVSIGTLSNGGSTAGLSFVYLKHPITLHIGLIAIVVGFIGQLSENLIRHHKLTQRGIYWFLGSLFIYLIIYVLFN